MEVFMSFSNKYRLFFLLSTLLGSSALYAMEPAGFDLISIDNQKITIPLDLAKKSSFLSGLIDGGTLNVQDDIPACSIVRFLTAENLNIIKDLYSGDLSLDKVNDELIPELFRVAHWFLFDAEDFPLYQRSILAKLALRCASLEFIDQDTKHLAIECLPVYRSIHDLIKVKSVDYIKNLYESATGMLDLSRTRLKKKLLSLEGFDQLVKIIGNQPIIILNFEGQRITSFDIKTLVTPCKQIKQVNLAGNRITQITRQSLMGMPQEVILDLRNNRINEIENGCFNDFETFNQNIIKLEGNRLSTAQLQEALRNPTITPLLNPIENPRLSAAFTQFNRKHENLTISGFGLTVVTVVTPVLYAMFASRYKKFWDKMDNCNPLITWPLLGLGNLIYTVGGISLGEKYISNFIDNSYSSEQLKLHAAIKTPYHLYITTDHGNFDFPSIYSL